MDLNKLLARVRSIVLSPKTEWPVIEAEHATTADLYKNYVLFLAAIPAVFTYLKVTLIGISIPLLGTIRVGFLAALTDLLLTYAMTLVVVFVTALIVSSLAPTFNGQADRAQALKTMVYVWTVNWLAAVALILPGFGLPVVFAVGLYSVYLLYLGLPVTMKCPREKAGVYAFTALVIAFVLNSIGTFTVTRVSLAGSALLGADSTAVQLDKDSPLGNLEQWSKELEKQNKERESAPTSRKPTEPTAQQGQVVHQPAQDASAALAEATDPELLKSFVPESIAGQSRVNVSAGRYSRKYDEKDGFIPISEVTAEYNDGSRIVIGDYGLEIAAAELKAWDEFKNDPANKNERVFRIAGHPAHEAWTNPWAQVNTVAAGRICVTVSRQGTDGPSTLELLRSVLAQLDLAGLDALKVATAQ